MHVTAGRLRSQPRWCSCIQARCCCIQALLTLRSAQHHHPAIRPGAGRVDADPVGSAEAKVEPHRVGFDRSRLQCGGARHGCDAGGHDRHAPQRIHTGVDPRTDLSRAAICRSGKLDGAAEITRSGNTNSLQALNGDALALAGCTLCISELRDRIIFALQPRRRARTARWWIRTGRCWDTGRRSAPARRAVRADITHPALSTHFKATRKVADECVAGVFGGVPAEQIADALSLV